MLRNGKQKHAGTFFLLLLRSELLDMYLLEGLFTDLGKDGVLGTSKAIFKSHVQY